MRRIIKYTFVVLVVFFAGCAGTEEYKSAQRYLERGDYTPALMNFERALEKNPDYHKDKGFQEKLQAAKRGRAKQLLRKALSAADTGATLEVVKRDLKEAATLDPKNRHVQNALRSISEPESDSAGKIYAEGIAYHDKKDWYKAESSFAKAISLQEEHILARMKRFESATNIDKADEKYRLGIELRDEKRLAGATAALKESLEISPFHPEAGDALEAVEKKKAEAEDLYRRGKESVEKGDWNAAEKNFTAVLDIWSVYDQARMGLAEACLNQVDDYEHQALPGHALIKCVRALEAIPDNRAVKQKSETLKDQLLDSISCRVGLLVTDASGDGRKAAKVEAGLLLAHREYWPRFLKIATREEMKITEVSPKYLVLCKVLDLYAETEKSVEHQSERVKVGTKKIPNPDYYATKDAYERANQQEQYYGSQSGLGPGLGKLAAGMDRMGAEMALGRTPMYLEEDVYETRHEYLNKYNQSSVASFELKISNPSDGSLMYSDVVNESDSRITVVTSLEDWSEFHTSMLSDIKSSELRSAFQTDIMDGDIKMCTGMYAALRPCDEETLIQTHITSATEKIIRSVVWRINEAEVEEMLINAKRLLEHQDVENAIEMIVKVALLNPTQKSEDSFQAFQRIEKLAGIKNICESIVRLGLAIHFHNGWIGAAVQDLGWLNRSSTSSDAQVGGFTRLGGCLVFEVNQGSPAERAGLRVQDIIVSLGGIEIKNARDLVKLVASSRVGEKVRMGIWRKGNEFEIEVKIAQDPSVADKPFSPVNSDVYSSDHIDILSPSKQTPSNELGNQLNTHRANPGAGTSIVGADKLGLQVRELDQVEKKSLAERTPSVIYQKALRSSSTNPGEGVIITNIRQGSKASKGSLNVGDIIIKFDNEAIRNVFDYQKAVKKADLNKDIFILIIRGNNGHYIKL